MSLLSVIEVVFRVLADPHTAFPAAVAARTKGHEVAGVRRWALEVQGRTNHNKATCALANKLARICYATLRDKVRFDERQPLSKKMNRQAFAMPV